MKKLLLASVALAILGLGVLAERTWAGVSNTPVGNANYQMLNTDVRVVASAALTQNRTWTLPFAGTMGNNSIDVMDPQGNVGGANSCVVIAPQSGDTINGSTGSLTFCSPFGRLSLTPVTGTNWTTALNTSQFVSASVNLTNAKQITTNSSATMTSVSLPPGDWDCRGVMSQSISATTTVQALSASIGLVDGVIGNQGVTGTDVVTINPVSAQLLGPRGIDVRAGPARLQLTGVTTVFLVEGASFLTSQLWAYGSLECRGQD